MTRTTSDPHGPRREYRDADLRRAERLLETAHEPGGEAHRQQCEEEAVVLTLDLADSVARRYSGRGIEYDDLVQVARLALVKAAQGYRTGPGSGFAAYAVPTITGEVKRHFRDCGWAVRPPRRLQELRVKVTEAEDRLTQENGSQPRAAEVAAAMGVDASEVEAARSCGGGYSLLSLDGTVGGSRATHIVASESGAFARFDTHDVLVQALGDLSPRELGLLRLRFVDERTQAEIGATVGVSQMQVSRLLSGIVARLRITMLAAGGAA
jgi:RNA polymerase sigma-B factor